MLIALNENGRSILAEKELSKKIDYFCPACKSKIYLKVGKVIRPHFAHYHNRNCQVFSEGETDEHLRGKKELAEYFKKRGIKVQVEAYLPGLKQRPDLLILENTKKTAIEFQCSSITVEKICKRTEGYLKANYDVIWILGRSLGGKQYLTALQKACLYFSYENKRLLLFSYNIENRELRISYKHQLIDGGKISYKKKVIAIDNGEKISLDNSKWIKVRNQKKIELREKQIKLMKRSQYPSDALMIFLSLIYQNRENIITIPIEIYQKLPSEWLIKGYPMTWKYRIVLWLESFSPKEIITEKMLLNWLRERIERSEIEFYSIQKITKEIYLKAMIEFFEQLIISGILKKRRNRSWVYLKSLRRFTSFEEKINA